jgi:excisionase family DNA binding protein
MAPLRLEAEEDATEKMPTSRMENPSTAHSLLLVLGIEELARLLRFNRKTAYELVASGRLPGVRRFGRTIRIDRDAVLEWPRGQVRVSRIEEKKR